VAVRLEFVPALPEASLLASPWWLQLRLSWTRFIRGGLSRSKPQSESAERPQRLAFVDG